MVFVESRRYAVALNCAGRHLHLRGHGLRPRHQRRDAVDLENGGRRRSGIGHVPKTTNETLTGSFS
jgi:hypothetical protein